MCSKSWLDTPSKQPHPEGRCDHAAFAFNGELYIFGGFNGKQTFSDMWKFNLETLSWKEVAPKGKGPTRSMMVDLRMCYCMVDDRIFIFGGYNDGPEPTPVLVDDLYIIDLNLSLKTLCKLAVIQYSLDQSELPHDIRWELSTMTT